MEFSKGVVESSISRQMIDFIIYDLNLTTFMKQLETDIYGIDEIFLSSLQGTDAIEAPGGFTHICIDRGINAKGISR